MTAFVELAYTYYADIKRAQSPRRSRRVTAILRPARSAGARSRTRRRSGNCYRLVSVSATNGIPVLANTYDHRHHRIRKTTQSATHDFIYDEWSLLRETILSNSVSSTVDYFWGNDLSETLQGAGGVGGLIAASIEGQFYFALYDNNGNITEYVDESGAVVASYAYDAFGNLISQSGSMVDTFRFRFSTKYHDPETGHYYYGRRFYSPELGRWINRDPVEEDGGLNLYGFVGNAPMNRTDYLGMFAPAYISWTNQIIYEHFKQLKEKLKGELKAMCPQKATKWETKSKYKEGGVCCEPEDCKATAEAMADAYVTALEAAYRARRIPSGEVGNLCACVIQFVKRKTGSSNDTFGQSYTSAEIPYLTCSGWESLAQKVLADKFKLVNDSCWSYKKDDREAPQGKANGDSGGHKWGTLRVMDGIPKIIDPWKSGGWTY